MNSGHAVKILSSLLLLAAAGYFGTSSEFYRTSLVSAFFGLAVASVVVVHFRVAPAWQDALILLGFTAVVAGVDFRILGYKPSPMAWFSFLGLGSLLVLSIRVVWTAGDRRKLLLLAFLPSLLFVCSEWFASTFLDWTERAHPKVLDLYLYSFDASLRVQLPFLMGQAFARWSWFRLCGLLFYVGLPIPIAVVYAGQLLRDRAKALPAMLAFLITGPVGILFYNLLPAMGPIHVFHGDFPWRPLAIPQAARLFLEPVVIGGPRNAIPSLHMGWVLLVWWYSRGLSWWERSVAFAFLFFTACATLGTGEHYFVDLVVAYPFALLISALCEWRLRWTNRIRLSGLLFGLCVTLAWLAALRYGHDFFWASPVIPWTLCAATVAGGVFLERRLQKT